MMINNYLLSQFTDKNAITESTLSIETVAKERTTNTKNSNTTDISILHESCQCNPNERFTG